MKIDRISIRNILGIESLEFDAGQFNAILGPNGAGKSSVLEAIKATLQGGQDATLLRAGADKGEVVLLLDNGGSISARVNPSGITRAIKSADGKAAARPVDALRQLVDLTSVNPVVFLAASPKDRARVLLDTMPIEADTAKLAEMSGMEVDAPAGQHALATIETVRKQVYDHRTGTNRAVKEKDNTINQLRAAMPPALAGVEGDESSITAQVQQAEQAKQAELERIANKLDTVRTNHAATCGQLKERAQAEIDAIRERLAADLQSHAADLAKIESAATAQRERTVAKHTAAVGPMNAALAAIRLNRESAGRRAGALATIKQMETELADLQADAERQTAALDAIDAYRTSLLSSLPIPGLEVRDGEIYRDNVPFDRLNTAQRVSIAVEVAKLRAGRLGVCCVDGLELMDPKTWEAFRAAARESDLQLFVTRVGESDALAIETD